MLRRLFTPSLEHRWAKARARARGPLAEYYSGRLPTNGTRVDDLRLLAIDTETTGLDPNRDHLLSVGYVPVDGTTIVLGGAAGFVIRTSREVGQSATYHGLTDDIIAAGTALEEALPATLQALTNRILLAHFARIEVHFLSRACELLYGAPLVVPVVDTLEVQNRIVNPGFDDESKGNQLRLWNARRHYGLPRYSAHEALTDALACAELYLAQVAELARTGPVTFNTLRTD